MLCTTIDPWTPIPQPTSIRTRIKLCWKKCFGNCTGNPKIMPIYQQK